MQELCNGLFYWVQLVWTAPLGLTLKWIITKWISGEKSRSHNHDPQTLFFSLHCSEKAEWVFLLIFLSHSALHNTITVTCSIYSVLGLLWEKDHLLTRVWLTGTLPLALQLKKDLSHTFCSEVSDTIRNLLVWCRDLWEFNSFVLSRFLQFTKLKWITCSPMVVFQ